MEYKEVYESWLANPYFDEATKQELLSIKDDENEIKERFYADLEFGTAGLRGVIGAGTNRMNVYVVRKTTQGLANYIIKQNAADKGVAIAFDSRRMSTEFANEAALCLAANGIKAYIFDALRPTPELSFAVRHLGCTAGINITASHNPPEYNGYKVYWADGAQITPPHDSGIMAEVKAVTDYNEVKTMNRDQAIAAGLYQVIGSDVDDVYIAQLKKQVKNPELIKEYADQIKIVYTPLHGTGNIPARRIMKEIGFENVYVVPEQELPDGEFPTVSYPNPESDEAFVLGLELAKKVDADLVLATDPDADRLGVRVKDREGIYHTLTGNMSGCLLADYTISQIKEKQGLPKDGALIKTIVTTNMADAIAKYYNVNLIECLTGFKYIGQQILKFETTGVGTYLFGFEESYGCLAGSYVRDKDAVVASMLICEMAAYYRTKGISMMQARENLYQKYGVYVHAQHSFTFEGESGMIRMQNIMEHLRTNRPEQIDNLKVIQFADYEKQVSIDLTTGTETAITLPKSNVLSFTLEQGAKVIIRPSGTEPKIKAYYTTTAATEAEAVAKKDELDAAFSAIMLAE